jgi:hypothetical protein
VTRLEKGFPYAIISVFAVLLATGCSTTLEGKWDGELDCGSWGDVDIELDLDKSSNTLFTGDGEITGFYYDNDPAELQFEIEITKPQLAGAQELDVELDDCEVVISGLGSFDDDCDEPEKVEWDGEDMISGEIEDFLGVSGNDCDFEVER